MCPSIGKYSVFKAFKSFIQDGIIEISILIIEMFVVLNAGVKYWDTDLTSRYF